MTYQRIEKRERSVHHKHATATVIYVIVGVVLSSLVTTQSTAAQGGVCAQPISGSASAGPKAADALFILLTSVRLETCDVCLCDVDGDTRVTVTDALRALGAAVGLDVAMNCPLCQAVCGDGIVTTPEQCDDANNNDNDDCRNDCTRQLPCVDLSGRWSSGGGGRVCCTIGGVSQGCDPVFGGGPLDLEQFGCFASLSEVVLGFSFSIDGPVTRDTVTLSTDIIPENFQVRCNRNELLAAGSINASATQIDFNISGGIDCDADGTRIACSITGTDRWRR